MLEPETNERLQDVAYDIEQALNAIGDNPSSYDLGLFEGKMMGLSVVLNAVACEIDAYCEKGNSESKLEWIPYEGASKIFGPHAFITTGGLIEVRGDNKNKARQYGAHVTHYLMLPELPKIGGRRCLRRRP